MDPDQDPRFNELLSAARSGNSEAQDDLLQLTYGQLRTLARQYMRRERSDHTLQATALVNEAYLRLGGRRLSEVRDRNHFFALAARAMRNVLVDHERAHQAGKRGEGSIKLSLDDVNPIGVPPDSEAMQVDELLRELEEIDRVAAQVLEMKYFGGMENQQIAEALDISVDVVRRKTTLARSWMRDRIAGRDGR